MIHRRYLETVIGEICFNSGKMAFVSGPRQCGKTTMAKFLIKQRGNGSYYNWDETKFRRIWAKDPQQIIPAHNIAISKNAINPINPIKPIIILDELHKAKLWKRALKGVYDTLDNSSDILVTGSARLNVYRKGSDSLMGRYYHFRLHPFSLAELLNEKHFTMPDELIELYFTKEIYASQQANKILDNLYKFGPFPEPLLAENSKTLLLWRRNRVEKIVREDLRDISRLPELSQIEMLVSLLPERASQPLSIKSLSEDLEVAYTTVKRWMNYLAELYYVYTIKPYAKSLARALKKESKLYFWDWSEIEDKGARYENLIAAHILKYCDYLTDTGIGVFELRYLKNKEKQKLDFLILKNNKPFLPIEAKLTAEEPSASLVKLLQWSKCPYGIQVIMKPNIYRIYQYQHCKILTISAASFLQYLV